MISEIIKQQYNKIVCENWIKMITGRISLKTYMINVKKNGVI